MALPLSRNRDYTGATPVVPGDINDLQDGEIGAKHGPIDRWFPPLSRTANDANMTFTNGMYFANAAAGQLNYISAPLHAGDQVTQLLARILGTGAGGNVQVFLTRWRDGAQVNVQTLTIVTPPAAWATYSLAFAPFTVLAGDAYWLGATFATLNQAVTAFGLTVQRP